VWEFVGMASERFDGNRSGGEVSVILCLRGNDFGGDMAQAAETVLREAERSALERRLRRRLIVRAEATRAEIILLAADGHTNCAIARSVRVTRKAWRRPWRGDSKRNGRSSARCLAP
jgi:hypothetical protein